VKFSRKVGDRVARIDEWLEPDKLILLEGWARDGLTYEQIAHNMGIGLTTLKEWRQKEPTISSTLKKGREVVDYEVENALLKSALEGNTTAQIFWLKNRRKQQWRERVEYSNDSGEISKLDEILKEIKKDATE
jgi:DNA invertase Pin-like site-specific DNA recombinase